MARYKNFISTGVPLIILRTLYRNSRLKVTPIQLSRMAMNFLTWSDSCSWSVPAWRWRPCSRRRAGRGRAGPASACRSPSPCRSHPYRHRPTEGAKKENIFNLNCIFGHVALKMLLIQRPYQSIYQSVPPVRPQFGLLGVFNVCTRYPPPPLAMARMVGGRNFPRQRRIFTTFILL